MSARNQGTPAASVAAADPLAGFQQFTKRTGLFWPDQVEDTGPLFFDALDGKVDQVAGVDELGQFVRANRSQHIPTPRHADDTRRRLTGPCTRPSGKTGR